ncbi:MAG TPA: MlaA family lipoprotein, partial [Rhizomicrobium sp.]|nr:MlaA family lipoprotein [Rhizomicrobium sp.]
AVQLPLFGSSNVRDSFGIVVGLVANPINFIPAGAATTIGTVSGGFGVVDGRAGQLRASDALEHATLDYYATLRSVAAQHRARVVEEGRAGLVTDHPGEATQSPRSSQPSLPLAQSEAPQENVQGTAAGDLPNF